MATIKDVAKLAGVSASSVSHVMNGNYDQVSKETRDRILTIAKSLNYVPSTYSKQSRVSRNNTVGIIIEDMSSFNDGCIVDGIHEYLDNAGYHVEICNLRLRTRVLNTSDPFEELFNDQLVFNNHKDELITAVRKDIPKDIDGIIYAATHKRNVGDLFIGYSCPVIYCGCYGNDKTKNTIVYNDFGAAEEVVNYLLSVGHKNIACITGSTFSAANNERLEGYIHTLHACNIPINQDYIKLGDWQARSGYNLMQTLMELRPRPTAVFCFNDIMAGGALYYCMKHGINVPREVSIVGFDNRDISWITYPRLTTVEMPTLEMGRAAGKMLIDAVSQKIDIPTIHLGCNLIKRDSVLEL